MVIPLNEDTLGNLTTLIKICIMTIAPYIAVQLGTDDGTVIAFLTATVTFVLAVLDAKYPNSFKFLHDPETIPEPEPVTIPDIDPAGDYDE